MGPPSSVSRSHKLLRMLHRKLMQIPGTTMVDTHMPIMDIMGILMPITGQEGREDLLNQSQLPMLTLRLTLTTTIEEIMDIMDTLIDTHTGDKDYQNKTSMKCQKLL